MYKHENSRIMPSAGRRMGKRMDRQRQSGSHIVQRILALLMALALILSMYLTLRAQIRFSGLNYVGQVAEYAAQVTADNTGYLSKGTLDRAWTILRSTIHRPRTYEDYDMYASIAIAREDYTGAGEYLQGCIDAYTGGDDGELAVLYLRQASLYVLTGEYDQALSRLDRAIELAPDLSSAYFLRAEMYSTLGETEKAVADLTSYKDLDGSDPVILSSLGQLYETTGDYESAIECYTAGITDERAYRVELLADRARCRLLSGDSAGAKRDLEEYFHRDGSDPEGAAASMLAVCRMNGGDYAGAVQMFHRAISDGYANPHILYGQAVLCAYMNGDYDQAAADGEKAIRGAEAAGENTGELHLWTGLACMVREDYGPASEHFRSAAEQDDSLQDLRYYLGICALAEGDAARAEEWFTVSVEREENVTASLYNRAVCRLQQGMLKEAKADLTAVTERNDDPDLTAQAGELLGQL